MASYVELTRLMNRANEQVEQLAKETTTKDIVEILNNPNSTPVEIQVAAKALEMTSTAAKTFSERLDEEQDMQKAMDAEPQNIMEQLIKGILGENHED
ncbi:hypothetical protein [Limosilactobacillus oris]|uniref:hypothetical protein n=1 Tax=Limosilactobacillus oris TaxID=1632 RepID=UPI002658EAF7|nr:hypothetical protein [Limosilactobacillus oris]